MTISCNLKIMFQLQIWNISDFF